MKKRIILGDIHGRGDIAIDIYNNELPESVIILGDYFDSHDGIDSDKQLESFNKILELRSLHNLKHKGDFIMLVGNHDYHYIMNDPEIRYSSWSQVTFNKAHDILNNCLNGGVLNVIHIDEKNRTIYSHAGVSNYWLKKVAKYDSLHSINPSMDLNDLRFNLYMGWERSGDTISQSPIWIRPKSLFEDAYTDNDGMWSQIVGHTPTIVPIENGHPYGDEYNDGDKPIWIIEGLDYYIVETLDDNGVVLDRRIKKYEN